MGQYCHKVLFFISTMNISLDFSAQYCTVRVLFLQEKMNSQILKDKNPGEKEFAEKNAIILLQSPPFLSSAGSHARTITQPSFKLRWALHKCRVSWTPPSSSAKVALPAEKARTLKAKLRIKRVLSPDCFLNRSFRRYILEHRMKGEESF